MPLGVDGVDDDSTTRCARSTRATSSPSSKAAIPTLKDEYVVYTAHWDHFGIGAPVKGDKIYNGALDNASGVAALLEIARAFTQVDAAAEALDPVPGGDGRGTGPARLAVLRGRRRSIRWRRRWPNINMDGVNSVRPTKDLTLIGLRRVGARRLRAGDAAAEQERTLRARRRSRRRASTTAPITSTSRSRACRRSIPTPGIEFIGKPAGLRQAEARRVHGQRLPHADGRGEAGLGPEPAPPRMLKLLFAVGYRVAQGGQVPGVEAGQRVQGEERRDGEKIASRFQLPASSSNVAMREAWRSDERPVGRQTRSRRFEDEEPAGTGSGKADSDFREPGWQREAGSRKLIKRQEKNAL